MISILSGREVVIFSTAISKIFHKNPYENNTIIILMGNENTLLTAYSIKGFSRTISISNLDHEFSGKYRSFLNQFKGWKIIILIDNEKVEVKQESFTILQTMIKTRDYAKHFVQSSVEADEIVAYSRAKLDSSSLDNIENIIFAYTKLFPLLQNIISFIYNFNFPLEGIYMLAIEMQEIIENITKNLNLNFENKFTVFVVPTLVSGIRLFVLSKGTIFFSKIIPYSYNKSEDYLAGLIEQSVSEILIQYKKTISSNKLTTEVISLTTTECADILKKNDLKVEWHSLSWSGVKPQMTFKNFGDEILIHNLQLKHPATNKPLRKVLTLEKVNKYFANSLCGILALILSYLGFIEYNILLTENQMDKFNTEYYKLSETYRQARKKLQDTNNIPEIYDIISDLALLRAPTQQPYELSKFITTMQKEKVSIAEILWNLTVENIGAMESELAIYTQYSGVVVPEEEVQERVEMYKTNLNASLPQYQISLIEAKKQKGVNLPNNVMVRTNFLIKGPLATQ